MHFNDPVKLSDFTKKYSDNKSVISNLAKDVMNIIKESIIVTNTSLICYTIKKLGKESLSTLDFKNHLKENYNFLKNKNKDVDNIDFDRIDDHLKLMESKNIIKMKKNEIFIPKKSQNLINYYSNNILHFFV